jgi:16S rRNA (cytosine1402-N4)-methyltransferase
LKLESEYHQPALLNQVIEYLKIEPGETYVDATIGGGGHSLAILKKGGRIFGIDCDQEARDYAQKRLTAFCQKKACPLNAFTIVGANFANLGQILRQYKITNPAGILFDLGTSFHQLQSRGRGFSFEIDQPLDMRMDKNLKVTAADLISGLSQKELYELFNRLGEEKYSRAIAQAIVFTRTQRPIKSTGQLAALANQIYQKYRVKSKIQPATKIFQALRIAVNDELNNLKQALPQAVDSLRKTGRLVVISFQGLEDRIVKEFFKNQASKGQLRVLTKKPICPAISEIIKNPRSRSAKLRAAEKL